MFASAKKLFALLAVALAVAASSDLDIEPPITSPTAGEVWTIGNLQTVTWDTSNIPPAAANQTGLILLGFEANGSENLNINNPLASGFPITAGSITVTTPNVPPGNNYIVVLFGDSGNTSPEFTISA